MSSRAMRELAVFAATLAVVGGVVFLDRKAGPSNGEASDDGATHSSPPANGVIVAGRQYAWREKVREGVPPPLQGPARVVSDARLALLQCRLRQEQRDPEWAERSEAQLMSRTKEALRERPGARVGVECRRSLCRVAVEVPKGEATFHLASDVSIAQSWPGQGFWRSYAEEGRLVMFKARVGTKLPDVETKGSG